MKKSAFVKIGVLAGVLAIALMSVSLAAAAPGNPGEGGRGGRGAGDSVLAPYIADALGVTVEEYQAAIEDGTLRDLLEAQGIDSHEEMRAIMQEAYEAAVADGVISEELQDRIENREGNRAERRSGGPFGGDLAPYYADVLGFSYEDYQAAVEDGSIREFIEGLGLTRADFHAATADAAEAALTDGVITQEQYDAILERLERAEEALAVREAVKPYVAEALGTTVEELEAAREDGTLRELYDELGLEPGDIKDAMEQAHDAALEDGIITQEQYDSLTQHGKGRRGGLGRGEGRPIEDGEVAPAGFGFDA